ncbi:CPBP family intramembrane glutamic endopeptidase [Parasediminibacterium paludis]|uniref:CPBP family intramembrane glutamic endopeptidase n=1 Tax=Parasediminibacterium paludis TaxID=908966 RepID=A0ABV8PST4_9BACT
METPLNNRPTIENGFLRAILYLITGFVLCGMVQLMYSTSADVVTYNEVNNPQTILDILKSYFVIKIGLVLVAFLFMVLVNRELIRHLGFRWEGSSAFAGFLVGFFIITIGTVVLLFTKNIYFTDIGTEDTDIFYATLLCIVVAFIEEISIRGYFLKNLMQSMNKWVALVFASLVFALLHLDNTDITLIAFVNIFIAGILLGINYVYTKNLWFSILLHFSWNFFQGPIFGYKVSGMSMGKSFIKQIAQGSDMISGGDFGYEGSVICTILQVILIVGLIWYYQKKYATKKVAENQENDFLAA